MGHLEEVHVYSLQGLGASYRMKGYFKLAFGEKKMRVNFKGIAFGGHYGGHNVNVEISKAAKKRIAIAGQLKDDELENLLSEVQRRLLNGEMIVEYEKIKPEAVDPLGNITG
jgi:hypothetical protein